MSKTHLFGIDRSSRQLEIFNSTLPRGVVFTLPNSQTVGVLLDEQGSRKGEVPTIKYRSFVDGTWLLNTAPMNIIKFISSQSLISSKLVAFRETATLARLALGDKTSELFKCTLGRGMILDRECTAVSRAPNPEMHLLSSAMNHEREELVVQSIVEIRDQLTIAQIAARNRAVEDSLRCFAADEVEQEFRLVIDLCRAGDVLLTPLPDWPRGVVPGDRCLVGTSSGPQPATLLTVDQEGYVVEYESPVGEHSYDGMGRRRHCAIVPAEAILERA